ncbi:ImmA/IrrE family metallo-endopeptidase [Sorangium sp. So ce117]|uniref:ImmA/IrrE family metallo-endopeptidase n=1 Tax=Sorangium sp. So ce117 TaxID=3133277 RepID=UPI003F5FC6C3
MSRSQSAYPADRGRSYPDIEKIAAALRKRLVPDLTYDAAFPAHTLFESLDRFSVAVSSVNIPLDFAVNELPQGLEGLAMHDSEQEKILVVLSVPTYVALLRGEPRARFSVAHEIGHAVLHPTELIRLSRIPHKTAALKRGEWSTHPDYMDTEWQANALAAALLMPAKGLLLLEQHHGELAAERVCDRFDVSVQAAEIRLQTFGKYRAKLLSA